MVDGPNENVNVNENNNDVNANQNDNNNQIDNQQNDNRPQLDNFLGDIEEAGLRARRNAENLNFVNNILNNRANNPIEDIIEEDANEDDNDNNDNNEQNEQNLDAQNNEIIQPQPQPQLHLEDHEQNGEQNEEQQQQEQEQQQQQQQPQPIARRPVTDLFGNGDDDDEAEFDFNSNENITIKAPQVNFAPPVNQQNGADQNNAQGAPNEEVANRGDNNANNPPKVLTEEEKQAQNARMEEVFQKFKKDMADLDAEEAAEKKARKEAKRLEKEKPVVPIYPQETNEFFGMLDNIEEAFEVADADIEKEKEIEKSSVRTNVYRDAIKSYRDMYKVDVDENEFASTVTEAFDMIKSDDVATSKKGQQMLKDYYKDILKKANDAEKASSYADHRIPDFVDVSRSTNNLLRAAMYSYTDVYHNNESGRWFDKTANGGLDAKELAELTQGDSLWTMDQKSDEAWEKQSQAAKDLANEWLKEDRPYEKMIQELNTLAEQARTGGMVGSLETMNKLMAAEWMLTNNPKMMVEDPEDPYNTIPNWGNKYWKTISATRDAIGISKHTSMRDIVQSDYAAAARAANSVEYNKTQFEDHVFERNVREIYDSKELQAKQFAIQSAAAHLNEEASKTKINEITKIDENKVQISVRECDEKVLWESQPKSSFIDKLLIDKPKEAEKESKDKDKEKDKNNAPNL